MSTATDLDSIGRALRLALPELRRKYEVESLAIFGSVARAESRPESEVDVLVRFQSDPPGLFEFIRLERCLSEILGRPVDLVMETALKPRLRDRILAEAVRA